MGGGHIIRTASPCRSTAHSTSTCGLHGMSLSNLAQALEDATPHLSLLQAVKYTNVASLRLTYLISDILETLDGEVAFVWPSEWSIMKFIFLANRYSPLIDHIMVMTGMLFVKDPEACVLNWVASVCVYVIGSWFSEAILMFRTIALWKFRKIVVVAMGALVPCMLGPMIAVMYVYVNHLTFPPRSLLDRTGCMPMIADQLGWVFYATLLVSETTVVFLTLLYWYRTSAKGDAHRIGTIYWTMYRDGTIFYIIMLAASIANMCFMFFLPKAVSSALQLPFRAVHSALCTRVLLHLRKAAARNSISNGQGLTISGFRLATLSSLDFGHHPATSSYESEYSLSDSEHNA
ncbi:hypothetical protein K466DRAFT_583368 [Polyporus arcularius HHB13444]|uniref:DUF6533 domain-containing protein n=1 Tax=Polyporus arcularius HHB13444 TaxID=1314778 RepID=A0A5C3PSN7_9APHY|nr:hypothetical protein K466DRAFT_583368 [Polyporus arcularius HHB13444]